jgi:hypothetical protein
VKTSLYAPAVFDDDEPRERPQPVDLGDATGVWCDAAPIPSSHALAPFVRRPLAPTPRHRRARILEAIVVDDGDRRTPKAATRAMTAEFAAVAAAPIDPAAFSPPSEPKPRASSSSPRRAQASLDRVAIVAVGAAVASLLLLAIVIVSQRASATLPIASHHTWHPAWSTPWHAAWSLSRPSSPSTTTTEVPLASLEPQLRRAHSAKEPRAHIASLARPASKAHATSTAREPIAPVHDAPSSDDGFTRVFTAAGFGGSR